MMNRRSILKSLIAGLFCGWLPKKTEASWYVPCKVSDAQWVPHNWAGVIKAPTEWITWVKPSPELLWSYICQTYTDRILGKNSEGMLCISYDTPRIAVLIYVTEPGKPTKQLVMVKKLEDGSVLLGLGFTREEIDSQSDLMDEAIFSSEEVLKQLSKLEFKIG